MRYAPADLARLDLLVLVAIAERAHDTDRTARKGASVDNLAYLCRTTQPSIRNALGRLRQRGLIKPVHTQARRGIQQNWVITELSDYHREGGLLKPR